MHRINIFREDPEGCRMDITIGRPEEYRAIPMGHRPDLARLVDPRDLKAKPVAIIALCRRDITHQKLGDGLRKIQCSGSLFKVHQHRIDVEFIRNISE